MAEPTPLDQGMSRYKFPQLTHDDVNRVHANHTAEEIAYSWATTFTDPRAHAEESYAYLVHGVDLDDSASRVEQQQVLIQTQGYNPKHDINLLLNPDHIQEKLLISSSIIDQDHTTTYSDGGFILKAPLENVLKMVPRDAGTLYIRPEEEFAALSQNRQVTTISSLMRLTSPTWQNEVVLTGTTASGSVEPIGIFIQRFADGKVVNAALAEKLQELAISTGLPLVYVVRELQSYADKPAELITNGIQRTPVSIIIQRDNCRYTVGLAHNTFAYINQYGHKIRMTLEEVEKMIEYITAELSTEQLVEYGDVIATIVSRYLEEENTRQNRPRR